MYRQLSMYPSVALHDRERVRTRLVTRASSLIIDGVGSNPVWNSGFFLELMLLLNFKKILMILTLENNNTYYCMSPVKTHTQNMFSHYLIRVSDAKLWEKFQVWCLKLRSLTSRGNMFCVCATIIILYKEISPGNLNSFIYHLVILWLEMLQEFTLGKLAD